MTSLTYYDTTILSLGALFLGIVMLIKGGGWAVDSAVYIARRYGISPMVVGFTIIAFGTSLPELIVSVFANLQGSPGIALGNVLGSNIANILLVLGVTAIFTPLVAAFSKALLRDLTMMFLSTILLAGLLYYGEVSRLFALVMILILTAYVLLQYMTTSEEEFNNEELEDVAFPSDKLAYGTLFLGLMSIAIGAEFLVRGAKISAGLIGVPESVVALSLIAFGTSLPELSTSIIAARKGQTSMVIGNIIGSNVFNILMIIGITALILPIEQGGFERQLATFDVWVTLAVSVVLIGVLLKFAKIGKVMGCLFSVSYILYNIYIYATNM